MGGDANRVLTVRRAARLQNAAMVACLAAASWCLWAAIAPLAGTEAMPTRLAAIQPLPKDAQDIQGLLGRVAGACPIRPAQTVAAVKDDGAAARLLKKLKLQGVVQMGDAMVAYVQVEKEGVQTVRKGQTLLQFMVEDIEPGKVTLSLQGVVVVLGHGS